MNPLRYLKMPLNAVDVAMLFYFIFGITITTLGVVVFSSENKLVLQAFLHYYLPAVFYFVAKSAFIREPTTADGKLIKLGIVIALVWSLNFFGEYYVVWILKQPLSIPWVDVYLDRLKIFSPDADITFNHLIVRTVLVGNPKIVGLFSAVLFVLLLPGFFEIAKNMKDKNNYLKCVLIGALLCVLLYIQLYYSNAMNKTVFLSMVVVAIYIALRSINIYKAVTLLVLVTVILGFVFSNNFKESFQTYTTPIKTSIYQPNAEGSLKLLLKTFEHFEESRSDSDWEDFLIGSYNSRDTEVMYQGVGDGMELRVLLLPGYFGLVWTSLLLFILIGLGRYAYKISVIPMYKTFGLMVLGLILIVGTDIHYPTFIRHGPLEVLMIVSGCLSTVYSSCRLSNK